MTESAYSTGANATVFLFFVGVGCGYIILAKLAAIEPFYVTFVPVGTMLAYALLIYLARNLRLRDDQSGDNLYYMGFLFTLTSLGVSLYQFTATRAAEEIVQNFGIAIGSTIAGICAAIRSRSNGSCAWNWLRQRAGSGASSTAPSSSLDTTGAPRSRRPPTPSAM
jgi:hypothetical protein